MNQTKLKDEFIPECERCLHDLPPRHRWKIIAKLNTILGEDNSGQYPNAQDLVGPLRVESGYPFLAPTYDESQRSSGFPKFWKYFFTFLLISFLFIIGCFFGIVYYFTPLVSVDEQTRQIKILGGLIEVDEDHMSIGTFSSPDGTDPSTQTDQGDQSAIEGLDHDLQVDISFIGEQDEIILKFQNGAFNFTNSRDQNLHIACKLSDAAGDKILTQDEDLISIDLTKIPTVLCDISVPEEKKLTVEGKVGNIKSLELLYHLSVDLDDGQVSLSPEKEQDYKYDLKVDNGYVGDFTSSKSDSAIEVRVRMRSGQIISK